MSNEEILKSLYENRDPGSHKFDFGHLLVIGGSKKYSGSPVLNSLAAYRSGVDLVTTAVPKTISNTVSSFSPSIITYPLSKDYLKTGDLSKTKNIAEKVDAVVIGGGIERREETKRFVRRFLEELNSPAVIDADAIHAIADRKNILKQKFVLTPHSREFEILTGRKSLDDLENRREAVLSASKGINSTIILKGNTDIISNGKEVLENDRGSPYMTKGGTGDILTGIVGALLARGHGPIESAYGASYINGIAGELASENYGEGLLPEEVLDKIPEAIKEIKG